MLQIKFMYVNVMYPLFDEGYSPIHNVYLQKSTSIIFKKVPISAEKYVKVYISMNYKDK